MAINRDAKGKFVKEGQSMPRHLLESYRTMHGVKAKTDTWQVINDIIIFPLFLLAILIVCIAYPYFKIRELVKGE